MTTVAIHQPQYLPWVPYFDKADSCDLFVYLDNVQFQRRGVQNRNQIKTVNGAHFLTVPVKAKRDTKIMDVRIANQEWQRKHVLTIQHSYAHAPFSEWFEQGLRPIIEQPWEYLADLNIAVTEWLFGCLGITCRRIRSSELAIRGAKDDLIMNICQAVGASVYISGQGAKSYQDADKFQARGIELRYQAYQNPRYPQCFSESGFLCDLSALDLVLNLGQQARQVMHAGRA